MADAVRRAERSCATLEISAMSGFDHLSDAALSAKYDDLLQRWEMLFRHLNVVHEERHLVEIEKSIRWRRRYQNYVWEREAWKASRPGWPLMLVNKAARHE
jgi:hypothetical protein